MKCFSVLAGLLLAVCLARAEGPDDQYVSIYNVIQEADRLNKIEQISQSLAKYFEAQTALLGFQKGYPDWNTNVIHFRLDYVNQKIAELSSRVAAPTPPTEPGAKPNAAPVPVSPSNATETAHQQLAALQEQVRRLQVDKSSLEAKLKEALAVKPAEVDPRELAKAEEKITTLQKENDLLNTTLSQLKLKAVPASDASKDARQALADANAKLQAQTERTAVLEKRLQELSTQSTSPARAPQPVTTEAKSLKQLENQRDELQRKLAAAERELAGKSSSGVKQTDALETELISLRARVALYEARAVPYTAEELALLKKPAAKLAVLPESKANAAKKSVKDLPPGGVGLATEAQHLFAARQLDKAEAKYLELLREDENNVYTLANLSSIELELNKLDEAEKHLQKALSVDPQDAFALTVLGHLKLRQKKYDEALEMLNRAAELDPQSAEIQNYLGIALSQKGMRAPAEAALRKAILLSPGYADAHSNLAVIYLTQEPPQKELARWHYQKAIAAGSAPQPELEKLFETKQAVNRGQ